MQNIILEHTLVGCMRVVHIILSFYLLGFILKDDSILEVLINELNYPNQIANNITNA
jgi:hypothetical protein